jgi:hypothetical protein
MSRTGEYLLVTAVLIVVPAVALVWLIPRYRREGKKRWTILADPAKAALTAVAALAALAATGTPPAELLGGGLFVLGLIATSAVMRRARRRGTGRPASPDAPTPKAQGGRATASDKRERSDAASR